jgi:hypothetical protein
MATIGPSGRGIAVSLIDTVAGRVLHRVVHPDAEPRGGLVVSENWVVYSYWNTKAKRTEMGVLAM